MGDLLALIEGAAVLLSRQQDLSTQFPDGPQFAEDAFQWPPCLPVITSPLGTHRIKDTQDCSNWMSYSSIMISDDQVTVWETAMAKYVTFFFYLWNCGGKIKDTSC